MTRATRRSAHLAGACLTALLFVLTGSPNAQADPASDRCVDANTAGQALRMEGRFDAARAQLALCTEPQCPPIVRKDCSARLGELESAQPTVQFEIVYPGEEGGVALAIDGKPAAQWVDGRPLRVDPGTHVFTFARGGRVKISRTLVIREGERARRERFVLPGEAAATAPAGDAPSSTGSGKTYGVVLGSVGLVAIGIGTAFGVLAIAAADRQEASCASETNCADRAAALSEHDTATTDATVSTIAFASGAALLVAGAVLFFTSRSGSTAAVVPRRSRPLLSVDF